jgi:hypothetical protein
MGRRSKSQNLLLLRNPRVSTRIERMRSRKIVSVLRKSSARESLLQKRNRRQVRS